MDRSRLPENLTEFFGTFGSERQNVIKACDFARNSPFIGPKIPVHGLMIDIETGKLDWVVNGYDTLQTHVAPTDGENDGFCGDWASTGSFKDFEMGEMKFPEMKIGEASAKIGSSEIKPASPSQIPPPVPPPPAGARPPKIPMPPPIRPRINVGQWRR